MRMPVWQGWHNEVTARAIRLLVIATLLGIGSAAQPLEPFIPFEEPTSTGLILSTDARADSILKLIGAPPRSTSSALRRRSYIRSEQVLAAIRELRERQLLLPLPNLTTADLRNSFDDVRDGGARLHRALDIHAPRGTPVLAVDDGLVIKLHDGSAGGISLYATDPTGRFIYAYAHLDRYHDDVREGMPVSRGDTLGYVGTTGNAPPDTPHLHFGVLRASSLARWSRGTPINPIEIFR